MADSKEQKQGTEAQGRDAGRRDDAAAKADEREALRRQGPEETEADLQRPEGSTAAVDPVITSNPD